MKSIKKAECIKEFIKTFKFNKYDVRISFGMSTNQRIYEWDFINIDVIQTLFLSRNNLNIIPLLHGVNINTIFKNTYVNSSIYEASIHGNINILRNLLKSGVKQELYYKSIYHAVLNGHKDVVLELLKYKFDINRTVHYNENFDTTNLVDIAYKLKKYDILKELIKHGFDVHGSKCLSNEINHIPTKEFLHTFIENGVKLKEIFSNRDVLFNEAKKLITEGAYMGSLLFFSIKHEDVEAMKFALRYSFYIDKYRYENYSILEYSCKLMRIKILKLLMFHCPTYANLYKILSIAYKNKQHEIIKSLLNIKEYFNCEQAQKITKEIILKCAEDGNLEIMKYFYNKGCDIKRVYDNKTLLIVASENGHIKMVDFLIEKGVDLDYLYIDKACVSGSENSYYEYNEWYGKNVFCHEDYNCDSLTAIISASRNGHILVVKSLIDAGSDIKKYSFVKIPTKRYFIDSFSEALRYGHFNIVKLLLDNGSDIFYQFVEDKRNPYNNGIPSKSDYVYYFFETVKNGKYKDLIKLIKYVYTRIKGDPTFKYQHFFDYLMLEHLKYDECLENMFKLCEFE